MGIILNLCISSLNSTPLFCEHFCTFVPLVVEVKSRVTLFDRCDKSEKMMSYVALSLGSLKF